MLEITVLLRLHSDKKKDDDEDSDDEDQPMDVSESASESEEDIQGGMKSSDPKADDAKTTSSHLESNLREFAGMSKNENMFGWMERS